MMPPFITIHRPAKSIILNTDRRIVLKTFTGKTARRRAEAWLEALRVGWFSVAR